MEVLEKRFDRWRLAEISKTEFDSKSLEADLDSRTNEIEMEEGGEDLRTNVGKLQLMMNEKNAEIVKIKSHMKMLVDDIDSNAKDVAVSLDDMIEKLKDGKKDEVKLKDVKKDEMFNRTDLFLQVKPLPKYFICLYFHYFGICLSVSSNFTK